MWKEIKCPKCNGTGKIKIYITSTVQNIYNRTTEKECICPTCNGYKIIRQKCFGTEKNKIKRRTKCSRFELMEI